MDNVGSREWVSGFESAAREIEADGWTAETARAFLDAIGALPSDPVTESTYGRGYNAAMRRLATGA
jgi:hypothetical protein